MRPHCHTDRNLCCTRAKEKCFNWMNKSAVDKKGQSRMCRFQFKITLSVHHNHYYKTPRRVLTCTQNSGAPRTDLAKVGHLAVVRSAPAPPCHQHTVDEWGEG